MQAIVHFTVGLSMGLIGLAIVDWPARREFLLLFASGIWGILPDLHWIFKGLGFLQVREFFKSFHGSSFSNVFWFHHFLDSIETRNAKLEIGVALAILLVFVVGYYYVNDWTVE